MAKMKCITIWTMSDRPTKKEVNKHPEVGAVPGEVPTLAQIVKTWRETGQLLATNTKPTFYDSDSIDNWDWISNRMPDEIPYWQQEEALRSLDNYRRQLEERHSAAVKEIEEQAKKEKSARDKALREQLKAIQKESPVKEETQA